jgi:anti-sigma B factor antagonist
MKIRESHDRSVDVFHLEGEIDLDHAPALRGLFRAKADACCPALVVDLSGVPLIDSTGISVLLEYLRDASDFNGRFCFAAPTAHVRAVFEMIRIDKVIPIFNSVGEAAAALCNGARIEPSEPLFSRAGLDCVATSEAAAFRRMA